MKLHDEIGVSHLYHFVFTQLKRYDISKVKQLNIKHKDVYYAETIDCEGTCKRYKKNEKNTYKIDAFINCNKDWPQELKIDLHYKNVVTDTFTFDETLLFILGHEFYHYLRSEEQVKGRDVETYANKFGLKWVNKYRKQHK